MNTQLIQDSLKGGWKAFQVRPWPVLAVMAGWAFLWFSSESLGNLIFGEESWEVKLLSFVLQILFILVYPGFQVYLYKAAKNETPDWQDFFWGFKFPLRILLADLLSAFPLLGIAVFGGLAGVGLYSLNWPGTWVLLKYFSLGIFSLGGLGVFAYFYARLNQWNFLLIERECSAIESVKGSWKLMEGHAVTYLALFLVLGVINALGFLALGIGLLITYPLTLGAFSVFYLRIRPLSEKEALKRAPCTATSINP